MTDATACLFLLAMDEKGHPVSDDTQHVARGRKTRIPASIP
jgi:hypothetical protein